MDALNKTFDEIYAQLLTDHENETGEAPGVMCRIVYSACASMFWGLYKLALFVYKQIFPDTSVTKNLVRHASQRGITRNDGESDASLLSRLLLFMRKPPAGGNQYDWPRWVAEVSASGQSSTEALLYENERGDGTIDMIVTTNRTVDPDIIDSWTNATGYVTGDFVRDDSYNSGETRSYQALTSGTSNGTGVKDDTGVVWEDCEGLPSSGYLSTVVDYLDGKRPVGIADFAVRAPTKVHVDVQMTITGSVDIDAIRDEIIAYIKSLSVGQTLFVSQLETIAINNGATDVSTSLPAANVTMSTGPFTYEKAWPGTVEIS